MDGIVKTVCDFGGCFSPYMFISSITQGIFASDRRSLQEQMTQDNLEFQRRLNDRHVESDKEMMNLRRQWMQEKLIAMRRTRAEQNFAMHQLKLDTTEMQAFFRSYLPISPNTINTLMHTSDNYRRLGYSQDQCPLNVLVLHTKHNELNRFEDIYDYLDKLRSQIGDVTFPRWCEKNAEQNVAILNLHAVMKNIPTVVISPYYHESNDSMLFTVAMWDAQSDVKPLIVPIFSMPCYDAFSAAGVDKKRKLLNNMSMVSALLSGCARDIYALYAFGAQPTLPSVLKHNKKLVALLQQTEMSELCKVLYNEYDVVVKALSTQSDSVKSLAPMASEALVEIKKLCNSKVLR